MLGMSSWPQWLRATDRPFCFKQVERSTPLAEALLLLDSANQTAALVLDEEQQVSGVLTRDKIISALEAESICRVTDTAEGGEDGSGCVVELAVGSDKKS